jgi:hypothetical protein
MTARCRAITRIESVPSAKYYRISDEIILDVFALCEDPLK